MTKSLQLSFQDQALWNPYRNDVINGNFDFWQRGTSQTTSGYGSDDRFTNLHSGSTKTHSQQTFTLGQTSVPGNPKYYSRTVVTSVSGSGNYALKEHRIENVSRRNGKIVTLTFYAKADAAKNIAVELKQNFGTTGSPSADVIGIGSQLIALTTSWTKYSLKISVPSVSGKTLGSDGNDYLAIVFWFDAGTSFASRAASLGQQSGTFDLARISLVEGNATQEDDPFTSRFIGQELTMCQRFYQASSGYVNIRSAGYSANVRAYGQYFPFPVPMRGSPTIGNPSVVYTNSNSLAFENITKFGFGANAVASADGSNATNFSWTADAEL